MRRDTIRRRNNICGPVLFTSTLLACILCWAVGYYFAVGFPLTINSSDTPLWKVVCQSLTSKESAYLIGFILTIGGAFLLHRANYALGLIREKTLLPFLFYLLYVSTNLGFFSLKSNSLAVFCLILAIYELFTSYHNPESKSKAFNIAFVLGIGSLLWIQILWYLPLFWWGMYQLRSISGKTILASFIGVISVYWFLLGWSVWQQNITPFVEPFGELLDIKFSLVKNAGWIEWTGIGYAALLTAIASFNILTHEYDDNLRTRQFLSFLIALSVWSAFLFFLYDHTSEEFMGMACVPSAILVSHYFTVNKGKVVNWIFYGSILFYFTLISIQLWQNL